MTPIAQETQVVVPKEYKSFLKEIKERILASQIKAALAVNRELLALYREIGFKILLKHKSEGWGAQKQLRISQKI